jgi:thioredoxin 2
VASSPTGIAVAIETKTRTYDGRHLARVREQDGVAVATPPKTGAQRRAWAGSTLVMMTIIGCPTCNARNRVGPIARGVPRCPHCKSTLPWVVDADADTFTSETIASVPVVVDFWAAWCGPCRMISPVLEDLAKRHAGHLKVVKVDVDANSGLATRFGAQSIPLLVVIRDGKEVDRVVGALPRAALEQRLGSVLAA